jgi:dTDP-4-dehydrorhamnose reductase
LLIDDEHGVLHLTNDTSVNLFDLAREIAVRNKLNQTKLMGVPQHAHGLRAKRPKYSGLQTQRGIAFPSLEKALDKCYIGKFSA